MALLSKTGHDKTTTTSAPWEVQAPYLEEGFGMAEDLLHAPGPAYFPGSTVAPFSADQITAQNMIRDTATGPNETMDAANNYVQDVLGGQYNDPYADPVFANIQSHVMPAINSQSMMHGRTPTAGEGANLYGDTMTRALTEAYSPWASQNWQFGQKQMMDAAQFAPELRKMDYYDAGALGIMGQEQQDLANLELGDAQNRWNYYQNLPQYKLDQYMKTVGGQQWGSQGQTITPIQKPTQAGEILGGALGLVKGVGSLLGGGIF